MKIMASKEKIIAILILVQGLSRFFEELHYFD